MDRANFVSLANLIVTIGILAAIFYVAWWVVSLFPAPFQLVGKVLVGLFILLALFSLLLGGGTPTIKVFQ